PAHEPAIANAARIAGKKILMMISASEVEQRDAPRPTAQSIILPAWAGAITCRRQVLSAELSSNDQCWFMLRNVNEVDQPISRTPLLGSIRASSLRGPTG